MFIILTKYKNDISATEVLSLDAAGQFHEGLLLFLLARLAKDELDVIGNVQL